MNRYIDDSILESVIHRLSYQLCQLRKASSDLWASRVFWPRHHSYFSINGPFWSSIIKSIFFWTPRPYFLHKKTISGTIFGIAKTLLPERTDRIGRKCVHQMRNYEENSFKLQFWYTVRSTPWTPRRSNLVRSIPGQAKSLNLRIEKFRKKSASYMRHILLYRTRYWLCSMEGPHGLVPSRLIPQRW